VVEFAAAVLDDIGVVVINEFFMKNGRVVVVMVVIVLVGFCRFLICREEEGMVVII
jgi:hypothetical protein